MKQVVKRSAVVLRGLYRSRPREIRWSIYGGAVGTFAGLFIGGIGVAAFGTAFGVPASVILAIVGGMIGNRTGVEKDNRVRSEQAAN